LTPRALASAVALVVLVAGCSKPPPPSWQRPDVSPQTAHQVELDCHQRAIEAIDTANNPTEAQAIHQQRDQYFERCMRGSGFELR
jgi:hypothetical protein